MTRSHAAIQALSAPAARSATGALLADLQFLHRLAGDALPAPGELARAATMLRRLLLQRGLEKPSVPKAQRIKFRTPDVRPLAISGPRQAMPFFYAGGVVIQGCLLEATRILPNTLEEAAGPYTPNARIYVDLDLFLSQPVMCVQGHWVRRGEVLAYLANQVAPGPARDEQAEALIRYLRQAFRFAYQQGRFSLEQVPAVAEPPLALSRSGFDCVAAELLAVVQHLSFSEDVQALRTALRHGG